MLDCGEVKKMLKNFSMEKFGHRGTIFVLPHKYEHYDIWLVFSYLFILPLFNQFLLIDNVYSHGTLEFSNY